MWAVMFVASLAVVAQATEAFVAPGHLSHLMRGKDRFGILALSGAVGGGTPGQRRPIVGTGGAAPASAYYPKREAPVDAANEAPKAADDVPDGFRRPMVGTGGAAPASHYWVPPSKWEAPFVSANTTLNTANDEPEQPRQPMVETGRSAPAPTYYTAAQSKANDVKPLGQTKVGAGSSVTSVLPSAHYSAENIAVTAEAANVSLTETIDVEQMQTRQNADSRTPESSTFYPATRSRAADKNRTFSTKVRARLAPRLGDKPNVAVVSSATSVSRSHSSSGAVRFARRVFAIASAAAVLQALKWMAQTTSRGRGGERRRRGRGVKGDVGEKGAEPVKSIES